MNILINFIDNHTSINPESINILEDPRYNILSNISSKLKEKGHNIYVCSKDGNNKKKITKYGWGKHYIFEHKCLRKKEKENYILFDYNRDKDKIDLIIGWLHGLNDNIEDIKKDFTNDIPIIYYESGILKNSISIDPNGMFKDSIYVNTINKLCEINFNEEKYNLFIKNYLNNNSSKRPQSFKIDIPDIIKGKYIFLPTQKASDFILRDSKIGMLELIKKLVEYCKKKEIYLVVKIHPHIRNQHLKIQKDLLHKLRNKYLIISNSSINYLIQNAIFTVTLNGGTIIDNFINQNPILILSKCFYHNTDGVVYCEDFDQGMEKMIKRDYDLEKMLLKQKKIVWWYITHNLLLDNTDEENINNLQKHLKIKL